MPGNSSGVIAVERAASLLEAFTDQDSNLSLGDLSKRVELDKSTVLRISRSLAKFGLLVRNEDSSWRLGPKLMRLGNIYQTTFRMTEVIEPLLVHLSSATGESAALYAREGNVRVCLFRHDSHQAIRHSARVGDTFPLDKGAPGRVILAFNDEQGAMYDEIRSKGYHVTVGERDPQVASIAVPVFGENRGVFGSLAVTGPTVRFDSGSIDDHLLILKETAHKLNASLGGGDQ